MSLSDELGKLAALRASGTLSEEEFTRAKERLLNAQPANPEEPISAAVNSFRRSRADRWLGGVHLRRVAVHHNKFGVRPLAMPQPARQHLAARPAAPVPRCSCRPGR